MCVVSPLRRACQYDNIGVRGMGARSNTAGHRIQRDSSCSQPDQYRSWPWENESAVRYENIMVSATKVPYMQSMVGGNDPFRVNHQPNPTLAYWPTTPPFLGNIHTIFTMACRDLTSLPFPVRPSDQLWSFLDHFLAILGRFSDRPCNPSSSPTATLQPSDAPPAHMNLITDGKGSLLPVHASPVHTVPVPNVASWWVIIMRWVNYLRMYRLGVLCRTTYSLYCTRL